MPVIKYTPQFTERQYVPMNNIGLIDQVLGMRQKEYDTAKMLENQAISELYGMQTTQGFQPERDRIIEELQNQIKSVAEKRQGDYGAAAGDIASIIAKAQGNPFFQRNRRALEEAQYLQRLRAQNPSLMVFRDPNNVAYNPNLTDEDLQYQVFDPSLLEKDFQNIYGDLAKQRRESNPVYDPTSGYNVATTTLGLTQDEVNAMLQDEKTYETLLSKYPVLQNANPEALNALRERIGTQVRGLSLGQAKQFLSPPVSRESTGSKGSGFGGNDLLQGMGYTLLPQDLDEAALYNAEALNELATQRAQEAGINVSSYGELKKLADSSLVKSVASGYGFPPPPSSLKESVKYGEEATKARKILEDVSKELGDPRFAMQKYDINTLVYSDRTKINEAQGIKAGLEAAYREDFSQFEPLTSSDKEALESIKDTDKVWITGIVPTYDKNSPASMVIIGAGKDKDGKTVEFKQYLKRDPNFPRGVDPYERKYFNFLGGLSDGFIENFYLRTNPQALVNMGYAPEAVEAARIAEENKRKLMIEQQRNTKK